MSYIRFAVVRINANPDYFGFALDSQIPVLQIQKIWICNKANADSLEFALSTNPANPRFTGYANSANPGFTGFTVLQLDSLEGTR